jgi:hypothetical protein
MKNIGASVRVYSARRMNCAVVSALISLAFVSQAFAVLRPLFPAKAAPPFSGQVIVIERDALRQQHSNFHKLSLGTGFPKSNRNVSFVSLPTSER